MFAMLSSFVFVGAVYVAGFAVASTFRENRARITDALQGRPLPRIRFAVRAVA